MTEKCVHDFHLVIDRRMKEKLKGLDSFMKLKSLSGIMVKILQLLTPTFKKAHKWGKQQLSRYKFVCNDKEEIRDHVHMYIPGELYRELKLLHQDLNFYSIAQLVRSFLRFFIGVAGVYGDGIFEELEKLFSRWKKEDEEVRLTPGEFMLQLWKVIQHIPGKSRLITVYDNQFAPFWVFRV
jgi:hypothetical protein